MKGKICIIGGGPAGLSAALQGARLGYEVRLFERRRIGDDIRCAEGFIDTLGLLGRPQAGVRFKVEKMVIKVENTYELDVRQNQNFYIVDRREWQEDLARRARELGAEIFEYSRVTAEDLLRLKEEYDWVIDASGVLPVTARAYGFLEEYKANHGLTVTRVLEGDFSNLAGKIKVGLLPHYFGYYWIFPKGTDKEGRQTANVGLGCFTPPKGQTDKLRLWDRLEEIIQEEGLRDYKVLRSFGGILPTKMVGKLVHDNILLVGDAGGLCSSLHGGGIDLACITGKIAVDTIDAGTVDAYRDKIWQLAGQKLKVEEEMTRIWAAHDAAALDKIVKMVTEKKLSSLVEVAKIPHKIQLTDLKTIAIFVKEFLLTQRKGDKWFESC